MLCRQIYKHRLSAKYEKQFYKWDWLDQLSERMWNVQCALPQMCRYLSSHCSKACWTFHTFCRCCTISFFNSGEWWRTMMQTCIHLYLWFPCRLKVRSYFRSPSNDNCTFTIKWNCYCAIQNSISSQQLLWIIESQLSLTWKITTKSFTNTNFMDEK